jgi:glycosyltransferase involved in cell wall biosynthesis
MLKNKHNNIFFIKNGIDIKNANLSIIKPPVKLNAIGIIANIDKRKNIEVIIDSLKYLPKDIKFYIAGNINDKKYQISLIKKAERNMNLSQVIFLGYISNIEKFYKEVDLIILPSLYEGTSNVILESFKYGKLILVSNIKENICLINKKYHEYFIFDYSDPKDLTCKIVRIRKMVMQKNIILKDFLENNFIFLENNYSLKKLKEEYSKLINN